MKNNIFRGYLYRSSWHEAGPIGIIRQFYRDLRCCWQRITKGYCERDVWEMDGWMLSTLPAMLEEMQKTHMGHPREFSENEDGDEQWSKVLGEMARLFREADEDTCSRKNQYEAEWENELKNWSPNKEKTDLDHRYLEEESRLFEYRCQCKNQAFELLSRWFFDLWD